MATPYPTLDTLKWTRRYAPDEARFVVDKNGRAVNDHVTAADIYAGAKKFLSSNHSATTQIHGVETATIPELFNLNQMRAAKRSLQVKPRPQAPQSPQELFSNIHVGTLDYIFDEPIKKGPRLWCKVQEVMQNEPKQDLSDLEVTKVMLLDPSERIKAAPLAFAANGRVHPEWRDVLVDHMDEIGVTHDQEISAFGHGGSRPPRWSAEKIKKARRDRVLQLSENHWLIHLRTSTHRQKVHCQVCNKDIDEAEKKKHIQAYHIKGQERELGESELKKLKKDLFTRTEEEENTLQIKIVEDTMNMERWKKSYAFPLSMRDYPDRKVVKKIGQMIVDFLKRWPTRFEENMKMPCLALVCERMRQKKAKKGDTFPVSGYSEPFYVTTPLGDCDFTKIAIEIMLFDSDTFMPYRISPSFITRTIPRNMKVPEVPSNVLWTRRPRGQITFREVSEQDQNADPKVKGAVSLAKYISFKMGGKVIDRESADRLLGYYRQFFQRTMMTIENFDSKFTLYNIARRLDLGFTSIRANFSLWSMVKGTLPEVRISTFKKSNITTLLDHAMENFLLSGDPITTWETLCQVGDAMNRDISDGVPLERPCRCTAATKEHTLHHCQRCFRVESCGEMIEVSEPDQVDEVPDTIRICRRCDIRKTKETRGPAYRARHYLAKYVKREHPPLVDELPRVALPFIRTAWASVGKPFKEDGVWKFKDEYTDAEALDCLSQLPGTSRKSKNLMDFSIDALFPYWEYSDVGGEWVRGIHCAGNLRVTTLGTNLARYQHLPAILHLASVVWSHSRPGANSKIPTSELHDRVMEQADDMHLVRLLTPYGKPARLKNLSSKTEFEETKKEWIRAVPTPAHRKKALKLLSFTHLKVKPPKEWTGSPQNWDRLEKIVNDLEKKAAWKLPRSQDGCPFPGRPSSMPKGWNFWSCWTFFAERVARQWYWCNRRWPQIDTVETLFLTACLFCLDDEKQEFLNLPLSFYCRHPLRVVIAHKVHGEPLQSGWRVPFPTALDDWVEEKNNMLLDTDFSNRLKHTTSETDEQALMVREHLLNINLSTEMYDPKILLRPCHRSGSRYQPWKSDESMSDETVAASASMNRSTAESDVTPFTKDCTDNINIISDDDDDGEDDNELEASLESTLTEEIDTLRALEQLAAPTSVTNAQAYCQQRIVSMFFHHRDTEGIFLRDVLLAAYDGNSVNDAEEWQRALIEVACQVKKSPWTSIWLLTENEVMVDDSQRIAAILCKSRSPELPTTCFLVRYGVDDIAGARAYVSWEPETVFLVKHVADPLRAIIGEFEEEIDDLKETLR